MTAQPIALNRIVYNGESMEVAVGTTVIDLLRNQKVRTDLVAVEVNLEIVPKQFHPTTLINEGDKIEVVTLVGGG